jgi:hypothetical protein
MLRKCASGWRRVSRALEFAVLTAGAFSAQSPAGFFQSLPNLFPLCVHGRHTAPWKKLCEALIMETQKADIWRCFDAVPFRASAVFHPCGV